MSEVSASFYFILSINSDNILASMGHKICYAELYDLEHGDFDLSNDFISYCGQSGLLFFRTLKFLFSKTPMLYAGSSGHAPTQ